MSEFMLGGPLNPYTALLANAQVELSQHMMWEKYKARLKELGQQPPAREQTLLQYSQSLGLLTSAAVAQIAQHETVSHEASLVITAAQVHKLGEARVRSLLMRNGVPSSQSDHAWRDKKAAHLAVEHGQFMRQIAHLPQHSRQLFEDAFLLQLARFPETDYPESNQALRQKIAVVREARSKAVDLFHFLEMFHCLAFAQEEHTKTGNRFLLTWVLRNVHKELNLIAARFGKYGTLTELFWDKTNRAWAAEWLETHADLPTEDSFMTSDNEELSRGNVARA